MLSGGWTGGGRWRAGGGGHHRLQLLHHAQPPLHFRHDPSLLGEGWEWNSKGSDGLRVEMDERNPDFAGRDVASALAAEGADERVIYTGTYSKPFATGVRVGFGILPKPLLTVVLRVKANHDFGTSNLLQQLLCRALASNSP